MLDADSSAESESRQEKRRGIGRRPRGRPAERGETPQEFLDHASLVADTDGIESSASVLLMTLHSSKGLEVSSGVLGRDGGGIAATCT